jgi:hypothetical protein
LLTTTPDKLDGKEEVKNKLPPIPTPPETTNAPVDEDVEVAVDVIANPDVDKIYVDGLNEIVVFEDTATPEPLALDPNIKGCAKLLVAFTTFILAAVVAKPEVIP